MSSLSYNQASVPGPMFDSMSSQAHRAHIALRGPMTCIVQQGSSLSLTFPSHKSHYYSVFWSFDLVSSPVWCEAETNITFRLREPVGEEGMDHSSTTKDLSAAAKDAQLQVNLTADVLTSARRRCWNQPITAALSFKQLFQVLTSESHPRSLLVSSQHLLTHHKTTMQQTASTADQSQLNQSTVPARPSNSICST